MTENAQQRQNGPVALPVPSELENLPLVTEIRTGGPKNTDITPPDPGTSIKNKETEFQWKFSEETHQYVREYIRQADQKSAFFFTGSTALIAFLYKTKLALLWMKSPTEWVFVDVLSLVSTLGLVVCTILCLLVIIPRLKGSKRGLVFFSAVAEFESRKDYAKDVLQHEIGELIEAKLCHVHDLSRICERKYSILIISQYIGALSIIFMFLLFLLVPD